MKIIVNLRNISGAIKSKISFLKPLERKLIRFLVPFVPPWLETYHLTTMTIPFGLILIAASFLARQNLKWLWVSGLMVFCQYITDILDGEIGRQRKTGLIKWGFYLDHFLDFVFTSLIIIGYGIVFPQYRSFLEILLMALSGLFIHEALACVCLGKYNVAGYYGVGATEIRLLTILSNLLIPFFPQEKLKTIFLVISIILLSGLAFQVFRTQKRLWREDMEKKEAAEKRSKKAVKN
ncbi:MAG: hypothetical protein JW991_00970 [Candidatus Pacebacteria bacterium]|nr:hypothetical protein [Candidatus Paceibacterota bacterium]